MNKILLILVAIIGFGFCANAQKTVNVIVVMYPNAELQKWSGATVGWYNCELGSIIILNSKGYYKYVMKDAKFWIITKEAVTKLNYHFSGTDSDTGKYYIDSDNVIHFTSDNGFEDTGNISYDENRKMVISYLGKTLRQLISSIPYIYNLMSESSGFEGYEED